jgi:glutathione S-transferase
MKLYSANLSPYGQRVKIALRAKGLLDQVEIIDQKPQTPEFKALNPTGKIPALGVEGAIIPESETIVEYLEDAFPEPALRPADPIGRARVRLLTRVSDLYVSPGLSPLFFMLPKDKRDDKLIEETFVKQAAALELLTSILGDGGTYAYGDSLTQADCALAPTLYFVGAIVPFYKRTPFEDYPKVAAYLAAIAETEFVKPAFEELTQAMKAASGR